MAEGESLLEQGIALARAGQKAAAYAMLRRALFAEGDDAALRVWLGSVAPTLEEAETHLARAVELEPRHPQAQAGLDWVRQQRAAAPPATPQPAAMPPAPTTPPLPGWAAVAGAEEEQPPTPVEQEARQSLAGSDRTSAPLAAADEPVCANCGLPGAPGDRFCLRCGRPLAGAMIPPPAAEELRRPLAPPEPNAWTPDTVSTPAPGNPAALLAPTASTAITGTRPAAIAHQGAVITVPPGGVPGARRASRGRPLAALLGVAALLLLSLAGAWALLGNAATGPDPAALAAGATTTALAAATEAAVARATSQSAATAEAVPTITAEAMVNEYLQQVALLMRQVHNQDADLQRTMQLATDTQLSYEQALTQFYSFADASAALRKDVSALFVPNAQRAQYRTMTDALAARDQAIGGALQALENLGTLVRATARATEAEAAWQKAYTQCQETKDKTACSEVIPWQHAYNTASSQAERAQTYAQQGLQLYSRQWDQYKQLLPDTVPSGDQ